MQSLRSPARMILLALALLTLGVGGAFAGPAGPEVVKAQDLIEANDKAPAKVTLNVVHATSTDGGVAPDLERISKWLLKSFPNYKSFKRLSGREDLVAVGQEVKETLPNGTTLTYKHLGWKDGFATFALSVGGLETTVNVKGGKGFLQAGRAFEGGMIVLAFRVENP
ncbi:MAG TPA: hypothetical protein PK095_08355 [Myxococcota bacterium]|nr:hypothetical protein [Myxococcota bacterium]